ncbi:MAG: cell surface protein SprA [Candidatus Latescibacterota bacterium]|nr:MAG: cell surface protein SprA [Candidatus Latescibacterota bacterium]
MAKRFYLFCTGRALAPVRLLILLSALVHLSYTNSQAQSFRLDLDDYLDFYTETPWQTQAGPPIDRLYLGSYHTVPNFLPTDFGRDQVIDDYLPGGGFKLTYRVPKTQPFRSEEVQEGAFIMMKPRDVLAPGVRVTVESFDDIAERRRTRSFEEVWKGSVVQSISSQDDEIQTKRGLLNVSIPLPLPGAVERIIGKGEKTNIDISGRESITFSGESRRVDPFVGVEGQQKQSLFPSLDMKQELDVRLQGQIGEKINIQVDHTSSALAAEANRIRLNYEGFDDDIVKLVELGNTSLSLPGSQLVSFSTASQGLFGVKALAQVGAMDITMIASKEEGEVSRASFSPRGGTIGQMEERTISDLNFIANTFFFLDPPGDLALEPERRPQEGFIDVYRSVEDWEVTAKNLNTTFGAAHVDSVGDGSELGTGNAERRQFVLLTVGEDYRFVLDALTLEVNGIELVRPLGPSEVLAVGYVNLRGDTIGDYNQPLSKDEENPLLMELIWPANALPDGPFGYTWPYMMRNIYNLGLSNIDASTLEVEILEIAQRLDPSTPDSSVVPWIRIFGLDQTDETGTGPPDNRVDLLSGVIDVQRGTLTFPDLTPFDPDSFLVDQWTNGQFSFTGRYAHLKNPFIYTKRPESQEFQSSSKFRILVRAASTTRSFTIDAFNITEGSEVVKLDGRTLQRNRDYTIDYETGEVELRGEVLDELTPSSDITIDYEFKPFAGGASSTLLGFNSILNLSKNSRIGTTWLYESTSSASIRPRLGEEPTRAIVGGLDANLQYEPDFLTSLVNVLPLVDSDARSSLSIAGGMAVSIPDPNTKGEVYIDDMEGVEDSDVIPLSRRSWRIASPPVNPDTVTTTLPSSTRERIFWYNIEPDRGVHRRDLNPDLDERESTLVPSIDIEIDGSLPTDTTRWTGIMTGFRGGGLDLSQGQFIEVWVNDFRPDEMDRHGVLHIDMGFIDEDFYQPDATPPVFNNEDANRDGFQAVTEDTGLDGIFNGQPGDDPDDDYSAQRIDNRFSRVNGTEGNFLWDTEDLDGSGQLETSNAYFSFDVDLTDSAVVDIRRDFDLPENFYTDVLDSWRLYRISLSDFMEIKKDGSPSIEQIKHMRIWFDDIGQTVSSARKRIQLAGLKIVGNRWEKDGLRTLGDAIPADPDTVGAAFALGVISTKTDPVKYIPHIRPNVQNDIAEKEQSLLVEYENIPPGKGFRIRKRFAGQGMDFTLYRDLNFFVHADNLNPDHEYYFQIAFDSLNFYEIQIPLTSTYFTTANWARVLIPFNDLTNLKFAAPDSIVTGIAEDTADPGRTYKVRMVGRPNLFNVRFLYAGLRNRSAGLETANGELWINDIYLGDRKRDIDFAQRFTGNVNFGNVINFSANWQRTGPDFRSLRQKRGGGTDNRALSLSLKTSVDHFVPLLGFKVPVTGNYSKNTSLPKFTPNGDTEITSSALKDSLKSESINRGFSATLTRSGSKNPLLKYTFDKLKANFSMSQAARVSPASRDTSLSMNGTLDYSISWSGGKQVRLFKNFRLRYWPNSFNYRLTANRTKARRYRLVGGQFVPDPSLWNAGIANNGSVTYVPFPSLTSSFRMQTQRDLKQPHEWLGVDIGMEINRNHSFQANYKPPPVWLIGAFSPDFNYTSGYREDASPNIRKLDDPEGVKNVANNRAMSLKMRFDLGGYLGKVFGFMGLVEEEKEGGPPGQRPPVPQPAQDTGQTEGDEQEPEEAVAEADTTDAETKPKPKADPMFVFKRAAGILGSIRKINASVQQRKQSSYSRIPLRPSLAYQFGLSQNSGVVFRGEPLDTPERNTENLSITMDSGVQLSKNIDVAARFTRTTSNSVFRANETETRSMTWPDLSLNWKGLENFALFKRLFAATNATVGYSRQTRESGTPGDVQTKSETTALSPSMLFSWKNKMQSNLGVQYTKDVTDTRGSINETTNLSVTADLKYTFEPGKSMKIPLPFLRNKTLKSRLDTSVGAGYSRMGGRRSGGKPGFFISLPGTSTFRLSPRLTYNFTRALNGSLFINYSRSHSDATNQTTTVVQVGITAVFTF